MNAQDLIFSNRSSWRLSRHIIFWLVWWIYNLLTQFFPSFWFPGWQVAGHLGPLKKIGYARFIEFSLIENFIGGLSNQIFFVYVILYFLLPRYLYKERWLQMGVGVLVLIVFTQVFASFVQLCHYNALLSVFGLPADNGRMDYSPVHAASKALTTLPVVGAMAICIKVMKRWWLMRREKENIVREKTTAELQLLKARVHPHFLFNSLNNIYSLSLQSSPKTPEMIQQLSALLHYMVYDCKRMEVPLGEELKMIMDYIALEKVRYGERLSLQVHIPEYDGTQVIAPLLLIPLVENSFKHGSSRTFLHPEIVMHAAVRKGIFELTISNSKPAISREWPAGHHHGLGLANVRNRLALLYPENHSLEIVDTPLRYSVSMRIRLNEKGKRIRTVHSKEAMYDRA